LHHYARAHVRHKGRTDRDDPSSQNEPQGESPRLPRSKEDDESVLKEKAGQKGKVHCTEEKKRTPTKMKAWSLVRHS